MGLVADEGQPLERVTVVMMRGNGS